MLFQRYSWLTKNLITDLVFILLVNCVLLSVCSTQANTNNGTGHVTTPDQKLHRTNLHSETTEAPLMKELGNFLTWFFSPQSSNNSTKHSPTDNSSYGTPQHYETSHETIEIVATPKVEEGPQRRLQAVPRYVRKANSTSPSGRQIEITDIQTSIGTELENEKHDQDPSQINLQDELESIDKFERKVTQDYMNEEKRSKRQLPVNGIKLPYLTPGNEHFQQRFSSRQGLFVSPAQHLLALQQQQAAALLQQQALRQGMGLRRPYFYDDYDDDSDSDSLEDDDSMGFFNPVRDGMRRGQYFQPGPGMPPYFGGIGRRSVDDKIQNRELEDENEKIVQSPALKIKSSRKRSSNSPLNRDGEWTLIDDYDLSSDFHKAKRLPFGKQRINPFLENENLIAIQRSGLGAEVGSKKACNGTRCSKQETEAPPDQESSTTESEALSPTSTAMTTSNPLVTGELVPSTSVPGGGLPDANNNSTSLNNTTLPLPDSSSTTSLPMLMNSTMGINSTTASPSSGNNTHSTSTENPSMGERPPYKANANCRCGAQSIRGEMVSRGTVLRVHTNPWLFAISHKNKHICSGTLINNRYVLTAAHCVHGVNKKRLTVSGGLATRSSHNFTVNRVIVHPSYTSSESSLHNLALLRLSNAVNINQMMRPICLPLSGFSRGKFHSATLNTWEKKANQLQMIHTEVKILPDAKCHRGHHNNNRARDSFRSSNDSTNSTHPHHSHDGHLCASPPGKTDCGGDSGGSLQVSGSDYSYNQIGIVGRSVGCRSNGKPGVYTDVRNYTRWILTETKDAKYCNKPKVKPMDLASLVDIETRSDLEEDEEDIEDEYEMEDPSDFF